jgi:ATP-dependent exoDNAse (exonuclease V) beta subunit
VEDLLSGGGNVVGLDEQERAERREAHARKLYMAMTRAGHRLVVLSARRLPPEMEALFSVGERE